MKRFLLLIFFLNATLCSATDRGTAEAVRQNISEWVQTQRILSEEKTSWRQEKQVLGQSISLLEEELDLLSRRLDELAATGQRAAEEKISFDQKNDRLFAAVAVAEELVASLEKELQELEPIFPAGLQARIKPLFSRLEAGRGGTGELALRIQTVLGILAEVHRFQGNVSLAREARDLGDGSRREVQTVYLGLAQAFFVDEKLQVAGFGKPGASGWEWTRDDSLASAVGKVVAVIENQRSPEFIALPVEVTK